METCFLQRASPTAGPPASERRTTGHMLLIVAVCNDQLQQSNLFNKTSSVPLSERFGFVQKKDGLLG